MSTPYAPIESVREVLTTAVVHTCPATDPRHGARQRIEDILRWADFERQILELEVRLRPDDEPTTMRFQGVFQLQDRLSPEALSHAGRRMLLRTPYLLGRDAEGNIILIDSRLVSPPAQPQKEAE